MVLLLLIGANIQTISSVKIQQNQQNEANELKLNMSAAPKNNGSLKSENNTQMSSLVSKVRHFENLQNETILIEGKLIETSDGLSESVTRSSSVTEDWRPITVNYDEIYSSTERISAVLNDNETVSSSNKITKSTFQQFQEKSLNSAAKLDETYKVTSNIKNRPHFHLIDITEFQSNVDVNLPVKTILKKQARFNIEDEELEFPNFETQFFGSFGELSSPEGSRPRPRPNHFHANTEHFIGDKYGSHNPNTDHNNHHHSQPDHPHYHHVPDSHKYHPKRETLSSHNPHQIKDKYSGGTHKDVSALYVDDPWKHIDKVTFNINHLKFIFTPNGTIYIIISMIKWPIITSHICPILIDVYVSISGR